VESKSILLTQKIISPFSTLFNLKNFKAHVSPHEMLQAVVKCSKKKFQITNQGIDPLSLNFLFNLIFGIV
jgi:U4/U6.U5 tri-snRNP-associated protein 2